MICAEIKKLNESILLSAHSACVSNIEKACICYSLPLNVAEMIAKTTIDTLRKVSNNCNTLIHPALISVETWRNLESLKDDAISSISIHQNFPSN